MNEQCFERMQFTGLKDKYGKEIYEGDVVQFQMAGVLLTREVDWDEYRHGWSQIPMNPLDMEIIGNIYDDPKLLTH
jgi:hypothetical protein